jgi:hypothetical protein
MRNLFAGGLVLALLMPALAFADSEFDGNWKVDLSKSSMSSRPEVLVLQNGMYECKSCVPMIKVKADGTDQTVPATPYVDAISIKVEDDHSILETQKKNGKVVGTAKTTVSTDGTTATFELTDSSYSNGEAVTAKGTLVRVGKSKRSGSAHIVSGSWRISKMESLSENALVVTLKVEDDTLKMTAPTGQTYAAKIDGPDAPYGGDPGINSVSVKRLSKLTLEETDKRDGKAVRVKRLMIDPANARTLSTIVTNSVTGDSELLVATRQ